MRDIADFRRLCDDVNGSRFIVCTQANTQFPILESVVTYGLFDPHKTLIPIHFPRSLLRLV